MQLKTLLHELPAAQTEGWLGRAVTGLAYDFRRVTPGMVFIALPEREGGWEQISGALDRGAAAVISERHGFSPGRAAKIKVPDAREALARAAAAYYGHPSAKLKVIGVTGSGGKTITAFLVKQILEAAGVHTGLISRVRCEVGERLVPPTPAAPEALEIQQLLAEMLRAGCQACVMEVGSDALDEKRLAGVEFDVGIHTNLAGGGFSGFESREKFFTAWPHGAKPGAAIINVDDVLGVQLQRATNAQVRLSYGLGEAAELRATNLELGLRESKFEIQTPGARFSCRLPLVGRGNVYHALAAVGAGLALNVEVAAIQTALNTMPPVPGRLERVSFRQPFGVFVDHTRSPEALRAALATLREISPGRVRVALGCPGNMPAAACAQLGAVAAELADFVLLTSDNPRRESPAKIATQMLAGFAAGNAARPGAPAEFLFEPDRRQAINALIRLARSGDALLIAGKGHETFQELDDTVVPFDDRLYAREALESWRGEQVPAVRTPPEPQVAARAA